MYHTQVNDGYEQVTLKSSGRLVMCNLLAHVVTETKPFAGVSAVKRSIVMTRDEDRADIPR